MFASPQPWLSPVAEALADALVPLEAAIGPSLDPLKCAVYRADAYRESFPSQVPFAQRFGSFADFLSALRAADASAVEAALHLTAEHDLRSAEAVALSVLGQQPWPRMRDICLRVLGRCESEASFLALLGALRETFVAGHELRQNRFEGGCVHVVAALADNVAVQSYRPQPLVRVAAWRAMGEGERRAWQEQVEEADGAYPQKDRQVAESLMAYAGVHACGGVDLLAKKLFADHPSRQLRLACGHALVRWRAWDFLADFLEYADETAQRFALIATMARAPESAVAALADFTDTDAREPLALVLDVLEFNARDTTDASWLRADPRWLDVLAGWSKRRALRDDVLSLLESHYSAAEIAAAQDRNAKRGDEPTPPKAPPAGRLLSDYQTGKYAAVWKKLVRLDTRIHDAAVLPEARLVAAELMKRFAENLDHLVEALRAEGYVFRASARQPPARDVASQLELAESLVGPLPLSLAAAFAIVGGCDLRGGHPEWKSTHADELAGPDEKVAWLTDPLVLPPVHELVEEARDQGESGHLRYVVSGDDMTKAGYSGGVYEVSLPDPVADAVLLGEPKERLLVDYLRRSIKYGGFAGFAGIRSRPKKLIEHVTRQCVAF